MMKLLPLLTIAMTTSFMMEGISVVSAFSTAIVSRTTSKFLTQLHSSVSPDQNNNLDRRSVLSNLAVVCASTIIPTTADAAPIPDIPSVTRLVSSLCAYEMCTLSLHALCLLLFL